MEWLFANLTDYELKRAQEWAAKLDHFDYYNSGQMADIFSTWFAGKDEKQHTEPAVWKKAVLSNKFFTLYAIGSSITDKKDPGDLDFLLATNHYFNTRNSSMPLTSAVIHTLSRQFDLRFEKEVCKRYASAEGSRVKLDLRPMRAMRGREIDVVVQYDLISEERWIQYGDRFDSIPLLRFGNPEECGLSSAHPRQYLKNCIE